MTEKSAPAASYLMWSGIALIVFGAIFVVEGIWKIVVSFSFRPAIMTGAARFLMVWSDPPGDPRTKSLVEFAGGAV